MKRKIGLKLFSKNTTSLPMVANLYAQGLFDYLELMAVPGTYKKTIAVWQSLNVPCVLHAPHGLLGFNLADPRLRRSNQRLFCETAMFADKLNCEFIIVHPGLNGETEETIRQLKMLGDRRLVVENLPFISLLQTKCVGHSPAEIKQIVSRAKVGFCLDIAHAVKAAFARNINYLTFIKQLIVLKPKIIHLCDCSLDGPFDQHLSLGQGEIDLKKILHLMPARCKCTLEVPEKDYLKMKNYQVSARLVRKLDEEN